MLPLELFHPPPMPAAAPLMAVSDPVLSSVITRIDPSGTSSPALC